MESPIRYEALILQLSEALEESSAAKQLILDYGEMLAVQGNEIAALRGYLHLLQQSLMILETRVGK